MYSYLADARDVFSDINVAELDKDIEQARRLLKRALSTSASRKLTLQVLPSAAKLLASTDLVTKKLASWYVTRHSSSDSEASVLAINTLVTAVHDPNPVVRKLAICTLAGIRLPELAEHSIGAVNSGLKDTDAVVRRAAVMACVQIFRTVPSAVLDGSLIDSLYAMIRDPDPIVIVNCLNALQEILTEEGGVVINRTMARYLIQRLDSFLEPQCATVLKYLMKYYPRDEAEALDIMNTADAFLDSSNAVIVISALQYFLSIVQHSGLAHLRADVISRAENSLFRLVTADGHEIVYAIVEFMRNELVGEFTTVLSRHYHAILCHGSDPAYLKVAKIQLLADIADESSVHAVLDELGTQARNKSTKVAEAAVGAIGKLAVRFTAESSACISALISLLSAMTDESVFTTVMHMLHKFDIRTHSGAPQLMKIIERRLVESRNTTELLCPMLHILGENSDLVEDRSPHLIEHVLDSQCRTPPVCSRLLTSLLITTCQLFLKHPAQYQHILGRVFDLSMSSTDANVRDKASFYYTLLATDVTFASSVIPPVTRQKDAT